MKEAKNLSGGQRQLIEIIRALVMQPEILILDEATSAMDPIIEAQIYDYIFSLDITLIIIAHRLSTIRDCDLILMMANGKVIEQGSHDVLLSQQGAYEKLVRME